MNKPFMWVRTRGNYSNRGGSSRPPLRQRVPSMREHLSKLRSHQKQHGLWWCDHGRDAKRVSQRVDLFSILAMSIRRAAAPVHAAIRKCLHAKLIECRMEPGAAGLIAASSPKFTQKTLFHLTQLCIAASWGGEGKEGDMWVRNWAQVNKTRGDDAEMWDENVVVMALEYMLGIKYVILQPRQQKGKMVTGMHPVLTMAQHAPGWEPHTFMTLSKAVPEPKEGEEEQQQPPVWSVLAWGPEKQHAFAWGTIPVRLRWLADLFARTASAPYTRLRSTDV